MGSDDIANAPKRWPSISNYPCVTAAPVKPWYARPMRESGESVELPERPQDSRVSVTTRSIETVLELPREGLKGKHLIAVLMFVGVFSSSASTPVSSRFWVPVTVSFI